MESTLHTVFTQIPVLQLSLRLSEAKRKETWYLGEVKVGVGQKRNVIKNSVKLKKVWERQGKNSESVWAYVASVD